MSVRFDFECPDAHQFTLWSDDARMCPICGSEFLKRAFITPPSVNSAKAKFVDGLLKRELDARGITNVQASGQEGDTSKVTYKTTPAELEAAKVVRDFPQMNDKSGIEKAKNAVVAQWASVGVKGVIKSGIGRQDRGNADLIKAAPRYDRAMVNRQITKDPENLQVKK